MQIRREQVCKTLNIEISNPSNADILQRLVRRYLFKLERTKEEGIVACIVVVVLFPQQCMGVHGSRQTSDHNSACTVSNSQAASILGKAGWSCRIETFSANE